MMLVTLWKALFLSPGRCLIYVVHFHPQHQHYAATSFFGCRSTIMSPLATILMFFLLSHTASAKMTIYAEPGRLTGSSREAVAAELKQIAASIVPNATYKAGESFYGIVHSKQEPDILFNLHFYDQSFCDPSFVSTVPSASGKAILDGFSLILSDVMNLAKAGYGSGLVILGQFQVGYTMQGTRLVGDNNCTKLTMVYNNSLDYCFGYSSMLQSHTPWSYLYSGCFLRSATHKYLLQMQKDCNLVLTDKDANKVLWASNTYLAGLECYLVLQPDMNLVIYDKNTKAVWASNTYNQSLGATLLIMQNDGYGVLYRNDEPEVSIWGTYVWNRDYV